MQPTRHDLRLDEYQFRRSDLVDTEDIRVQLLRESAEDYERHARGNRVAAWIIGVLSPSTGAIWAYAASQRLSGESEKGAVLYSLTCCVMVGVVMFRELRSKAEYYKDCSQVIQDVLMDCLDQSTDSEGLIVSPHLPAEDQVQKS